MKLILSLLLACLGLQAQGFCSKSYTVTVPSAFPSLPLPSGAVVYKNGMLMSIPGDYSVASASFQMVRNVLNVGDKITVLQICPSSSQSYPFQNGIATQITSSGSFFEVDWLPGDRILSGADLVQPSDCGKTLYAYQASTVSVPQANIGGNFPPGCQITVTNYSSSDTVLNFSGSLVGNPSWNLSSLTVPAVGGSNGQLIVGTFVIHSATIRASSSNLSTANGTIYNWDLVRAN